MSEERDRPGAEAAGYEGGEGDAREPEEGKHEAEREGEHEHEEDAREREQDAREHEEDALSRQGDAEAPPMTDEERVAALREELKRLRVADIAHDMMLSLVTLGYQKLGLTAETRDLRDLDDARLAIDLLRATLDVLEGARGLAGVEAFRSTVATMQLNYARVAMPSAPRAAEPAGEPAADAGDTAVPDAAAGDTAAPTASAVDADASADAGDTAAADAAAADDDQPGSSQPGD
jgi:hypothetical protein